MTIFSASELDAEWKDEFMTFLEDTVSEQRNEIAVLNSEIVCKPLLTLPDIVAISNEVQSQINEILTFHRFFKKYFKSNLISSGTQLELVYCIWISNKIIKSSQK